MKAVSIYMTFPDQNAAQNLIQILLEQRLIACANVFPAVTSHYWWEGVIQEDAEVVAIAKTTANKKDAIKRMVETHHPYDVPCLLFSAINDGSHLYLNWLESQLGEP